MGRGGVKTTAMDIIFADIGEDDVRLDPVKVAALDEKLRADRKHNMEVMRRRGKIITLEVLNPEILDK